MGGITSSAVGRGFDREVASYFAHRGYVAVKSAGSKTCIDIAAFPAAFPGQPCVIQCKAGAGRVTLREWTCLLTVAERSGGFVLPLVALRDGTQPIFYRILGPMKPRTRTENLPWTPWSLPDPRIPGA